MSWVQDIEQAAARGDLDYIDTEIERLTRQLGSGEYERADVDGLRQDLDFLADMKSVVDRDKVFADRLREVVALMGESDVTHDARVSFASGGEIERQVIIDDLNYELMAYEAEQGEDDSSIHSPKYID